MSRSASPLVLVFCLLWAIPFGMWGDQFSAYGEPSGRTAAEQSQPADTLLLDQYPDAYAAYSLRKLRSDYSGPAIRVRRGSDGAQQDFGFGGNGKLDADAVETWLSGADGYVTTWYSQIEGEPNLTQSGNSRQPFIAKGGTVTTDSDGRIAIKFDRTRNTYLTLESQLSASIPVHESLIHGVGEKTLDGVNQGIINLAQAGNWSHGLFSLRGQSDGGFRQLDGVSSGNTYPNLRNPSWWAYNFDGSSKKAFSNNARLLSDSLDEGTVSSPWLTIGVKPKNTSNGYEGYLTEVAVLPGQATDNDIQDVYDIVNAAWGLGPSNYNREALLPQKNAWQVTLYNWLETIEESDVELPDGDLTYDNSYSSVDELADLWMQVKGLTGSSVTRAEPEWYTLDAGNGKGIEATGVIRANHDPKGGNYGGNPPRSWENEPAYLYQLDIPLSDGSQGNDFYQNSALGRRAMIVSMVDLMMHEGYDGGSYDWFDMIGKAFLGMAEAYRWAGDVLPADVQDAYESGMGDVLDHLISRGPRAVNTNMDMFALHGAADLYAATEDEALQEKCIRLVKDALFGYPDGELGSKHKLFAVGGGNDGGVFHPAGFIMEGGQPDVFYGGESIYQLMGALQAVTDRETGDVPSEWSFLEEVVRRLQEWRTYQHFYDPARHGPYNHDYIPITTAGAGFSGRTGAGVPKGQANEVWKTLSVADRNENDAFKAEGNLPTVSEMEAAISEELSSITEKLSSYYTDEKPNEWSGWSPWTKKTPYLPPKGWYDRLTTLQKNDDPNFVPPHERTDNTFNKTFGGYPVGKEYWSYIDTDGNGDRFGFFIEAQAEQGPYGGWYGGKIETFWTESTGVVLINRHGKSGCDNNNEDSACFNNIDKKAAHHVWGRDENGKGFTTLLLRGQELERTSTFDDPESPTTLEVKNIFNDPNHSEGTGKSGEETGTEIGGEFEVENKFEVQSDGLTVTHTITSDQTDEVNELWASLPVYLRYNNPTREGDNYQSGLEDTLIEYWNGAQWDELPDSDNGTPSMVTTDVIRLGRDYLLGEGMQYVYISFAKSQSVRRSEGKYHDPYQTRNGVRTVHIDLHGNPGTTKTLPAEKSVSYTIQTTDPTSENSSTGQMISLQKGGDIVSASVVPEAAHMDSVFAGLQSQLVEVENEDGEHYRPADNVNEIGTWNSKEAYVVYTEADATLSIQGESLESRSFELEQGWNWVPYIHDEPLPIEEALSSIADALVLVKGEEGGAYAPDKGIEVLETMEPGEGYKVYVSESVTLTYPGDSE